MVMDAAAQLALMTKARLVFESSGTFLSFPVLSPLTYSPEQLTFTTDGELTAQDLAELSEFARVTNVMPGGPIAPLTSGDMLWDVFSDVLDTAERATGTMTAAEQAQYDAALAYLYEPAAPGSVLRSDSAELRAYRQCRDAFITAQETYTAAKLTATSSADPAVTAQWDGIDEPRLRADVAGRETAWTTTGHRDQVEAALQVELAMGARSPAHLWTQWQTAYLQVIDQTTDTSGSGFATTGFAPSDVFGAGSWPSFTLDAAEISALIAQGSPELTATLGQGAGTSDLESISFEFRSVGVLRPWFRPAMFEAHFWRLGPEGGELSDGQTPPAGRCPSYIAGLVFARNIMIKRHAQPPAQLDSAHWRELMMLRADQVSRVETTGPGVMIRDHRTVAGEPLAATSSTTTGMPFTGTFAATRRTVSAPLFAADAVVRDHRTPAADGGVIRDHRLGGLLEGQVFTSAPPAAPPAAPPEVVTPPVVTPGPDEPPSTDITILAYICHRMLRCPDPDPGLHWPTGP